MTKPIVLLDCDGILTNYAAKTVEVLNSLKLRPEPFVEEDITNWEGSNFVPKHRLDEYWDVCRAEGFVSSMVPYMEAQEAVYQLKCVAEVVVVTSYLKRSPTWVHERDRWLKKHFDIEPDHVIHTRAKQHVSGHVFVDDALKNVTRWQLEWPESHAFLWDKPYNRIVPPHDADAVIDAGLQGARRVDSWAPILEVVRELGA